LSNTNFNYSKLRGRIREIYGTETKLAADMGMDRMALSVRLNNKREFSQTEILKICELLKIGMEGVVDYFLTIRD